MQNQEGGGIVIMVARFSGLFVHYNGLFGKESDNMRLQRTEKSIVFMSVFLFFLFFLQASLIFYMFAA